MTPGQFGPIRREPSFGLRGRGARLIMSMTGMPSVMQMTSLQPASTASRIASAAPGGGHEDHDRVGARLLHGFVDGVEDRTTLPRPPRTSRRRGRACTPATTCVPYAMHCLAWNAPAPPVMPWTTTLGVLVDENAHLFYAALSRVTAATIFCAPSAIVVGGLDGEAALAQDLLAQLDVRAFEAHDERDLEAELLRRGDDAVRR